MIQKSGFRSLGDDEAVEFLADEGGKGLEATEVRAVGGGEVQGSHRRPRAKKKTKKVRFVCLGCIRSHNFFVCCYERGNITTRKFLLLPQMLSFEIFEIQKNF